MRHVLFVLVIVLLVPNAHAEITGGWFADPAGERNWGTYPSGRFSLYYVVWGNGEEIEAVEVGLRGYEQQLFTTGLEVLVDGAIAPTDTIGVRDFVVELDACRAVTDPVALLRIDMLSINFGSDLYLLASGIDTPSPQARSCGGVASTIVGVPVLITDPPPPDCFWGGPFDYSFILNPAPLCPNSENVRSFGEIKARY